MLCSWPSLGKGKRPYGLEPDDEDGETLKQVVA